MVYIVEAMTGKMVWNSGQVASIKNGPMKNAVPSRIRVLDVDRNGSIDRLYFGDTGGNVWRADLNASDADGDIGNITKATLSKFAKLGGNGSNARKFFEEPSVAVFQNKGKLVASVAIGSGDRPDPLNKAIHNNFFLLYDREVRGKHTANPIEKGMLDTIPTSGTVTLSSTEGWYREFDNANGEKVLSTAVTYQGKVVFTTFQVEGVGAVPNNICDTQVKSKSKLYVIDLFSAKTEAAVDGERGVIAPTPQIITKLEANDGSDCKAGDCGIKVELPPYNDSALDDIFKDSKDGKAVPGSLPRIYWIDEQG